MAWFWQAEHASKEPPVDHKQGPAGACPVAHEPAEETRREATCPVDAEASVNPRNFMPTYSQRPIASQKGALPTNRTTSTIPKADDDETHARSQLWEYPSPQQFFNAVMKKGFTNTQEEDVPAMVEIHNAVNERAWQEILLWEQDKARSCGGVKLVRFRGDSKHVTPKARILSFLGYSRPFDTHFWTIDRCGERIDYVIDFYKGRQTESSDPRKLQMPSFYLDVRPMGIEGLPARVKRACGL